MAQLRQMFYTDGGNLAAGRHTLMLEQFGHKQDYIDLKSKTLINSFIISK